MADTDTPSGPPSSTTPRQIPITTPSRRAYSAEPPTTLRRSIRTPSSNRRAANNPPTATTPHGRAALRALDSRRAAIFTPGRRRSLRDLQRETPRDFLRALSRNLAPKTEPVHTSSSPGGDKSALKSEGEFGTGAFRDDDDDGDDGGDLRAPELTLPIDVDDDEADWPRPHRSSGLELLDDQPTLLVERGRRAFSEGPRRSSLVSRYSDAYPRYDERGEIQDEDAAALARRLHSVDERGALVAIDEEGDSEMTTRLEFERVEREDTRRMSDFLPLFEERAEETVIAGETTVYMPTEIAHDDDGPGVDDEPMLMEEEPLYVEDQSHVHFADDVVGGDEEPEIGQEQDFEDIDDDVEDEAEEFTTEVDSAIAKNATSTVKGRKKKIGVKMSKHGIQYPSLPPAVVKRLAQTFAKTGGVKGKISPDTLAAIMQASDWFFEQLGDDLQAYAKHAGRKTIDESDMLQLMRRQRQINASTTPFSLAQRYLPRELLQEMRMPPPAPVRKSREGKPRQTQVRNSE